MTTAMVPVPTRYEPGHRFVADLYTAAIVAVDPAHTTAAALGWDGSHLTIGERRVPLTGRVIVVGMGKAATRMAWATDQAFGGLVLEGLVVTKDGHRDGSHPKRIEVIEAAHPLPDERSLTAGERLLGVAASATTGDIVIALISGGGSSLAEALRPPLALSDLRTVTDLLLRAGATIGDLNTVRRPMSRLKAGGLLATSRAPVYPLILSDVIGNDLGIIASGATIPGPPVAGQADAALAVLRRYGIYRQAPTAVLTLLECLGSAPATAAPPSMAPVFIGDNGRAVDAIASSVGNRGLTVSRPVEWQGREGEAAGLGAAFVATCLRSDADVIVGGGEATVTVRGDGVGGRNTEFALAAAIALAGAPTGGDDWVVASLATDGEDALTGAAGAIADAGTVQRIRSAGIDPFHSLRQNDSLPCFVAAGGLLSPGPTGTNVNDLYIGVRLRRSDGQATPPRGARS